MTITRWLTAALTPLAFGALLTTAQAQGKGKGGADGGQKERPQAARTQARGTGKSEARPAQVRGESQKSARGESEKSARGESQKNARGEAEKSARGEAQKSGRGEAQKSARGESQKNVRGESQRNARGEARVANETGGLVVGSESRGRSRLHRTLTINDLRPAVRPFATSGRPAERFLGRAVGLGEMRGLSDDDLKLARAGNRVHVMNGRGDVLLDLDDEHAREIGSWKVATVNDLNKEGSPSFCRSGAGHPVWGRQWCVEKGFGLGAETDTRWGRAVNVGDIVLRRPMDTGDLRRDVLSQVLGDIVFNRLAAHAITLGLTDPLTGRWIGETTGPKVLLVSSAEHPVAEVVDLNRDGRADMLLVALRPW